MERGQKGFWVGTVLTWVGVILLAVGVIVGWALPAVGHLIPAADVFGGARSPAIDIGAYLGAYLTALAVIIAVVIGFNASTLQIAGQTHSISLLRAILLSIGPFLVCWSLTTFVGLFYFIDPPESNAQVWQLLFWFAAVVLLMVGYLWDLPWRLSGDYAASWATRQIGRQPVNRWEPLDGYAVLQSGISAAAARGDTSTVRAMAMRLGSFLAGMRDKRAEASNTYDRSRYRAMKNLLSGCAQNMSGAANASVYYLGYVAAGVILLAAAVGHPLGDDERDLFSGLFRALRGASERMDALWTGMRHALCRKSSYGEPYLIIFWRTHGQWPSDDPRRSQRIAAGVAQFLAGCMQELLTAHEAPQAYQESTELVRDFYRDMAQHLAPAMAHARFGGAVSRPEDLPIKLLDAVHTQVLAIWPATAEADAQRVALVNAYEARRRELTGVPNGMSSASVVSAVS